MKRWIPISIALLATAACRHKAPAPLSFTVNAIEHTTPPDAGVWSAKTIASKTSAERAHMDVLVDVLREAKAKGPIRCTFMEGGEPTGLRFDRNDGAKFWVYGAHAYAQKGDCYTIDAANAEKLRALAKTLGVNEPS